MYTKLNWLSIFSIFMLFLLGGLVRSTGSGMGCPDWPKCFGEYIPPTSETELPADYEDYFKEQRIEKTNRFVTLLKSLGFNKKANELENNPQIEESHKFNAIKAYVEYINRLWGAVTGLIVFLCFLFSLSYLRGNPKVFIYSTIGFVAVFLNALLGAVVVHSNLIGGIVTAHFIAAFVSICAFIIARKYALERKRITISNFSKNLILITTVLTFIQVLLGANLREYYDLLTSNEYLDKVASLFPHLHIHAILGVIVMALAVLQLVRYNGNESVKKHVIISLILASLQVVVGPLALSDSFEAFSKLFHITLGAGLFVVQFYICTTILGSKNFTQV